MSNFQSYQSYQPAADEPQQASSYQPARITGETHRFTFTDGSLSQETVPSNESARVGDLNPWAGTDSFEATARNQNGTPLTSLLPSTLVTLDGVQAPVSTFVAAGRLQKMADGTYAEAAAAPEVAPEDTSDVMPMESDSMDAVNAALDTVDQGNLAGLMSIGIAVAVNDLDPRSLSHRFTEVSGIGGAEGDQRLETMRAAYQHHANVAVITRSGIGVDDLPAFWAFAKQNHRGELQQAVQKQLNQNDVSGYRVLAQKWQAATPPSIAALAAGGIRTRNLGQGDECFVQGQWMTPKAAAKIGLL